ncbi:MAG: diguanylate cyclase [Firmicutes bacterium]|nr:diguanylate cyclase [Bacillota bacterium]
MKLSIKYKLMVTLLILIIIPIIILGTLSYHKARGLLISEMQESSLKAMENANDFFINNYINQIEIAVNKFSKDPQFRKVLSEPNALKESMKEWEHYLEYNSHIFYIYIGTKDGNIYTSSEWNPPEDYDPRVRPWYKAAFKKTSEVVWSKPYEEYISHLTVISAVKTVEDNSGDFIGVFGMDTSLNKLSEIVSNISFGKNGYAMLIDKTGNIIAHQDVNLLGQSVVNKDWFKNLPLQNKGSILYEYNGKDTFISYVTVPKTGWKLIGFIPKATLEEKVAPIKNRSLTVGIVSSLIAIMLSIYISNRTAGKIDGLINTMSIVEEGNFKVRSNLSTTDEFQQLNNKFNSMVSTVDKLIEEQMITESKLELQKAFFEQLFENSPESIAILNSSGQIVNANKQFEILFQYTIDEIKGQRITNFIVPKGLEQEGSNLTQSVINNNSVEKETVRKRKDGSLVDVLILGYPIIVDGSQVGVYAIYRDITNRKKTENELKYISMHDGLTKAYNRTYFEQKMQSLEKEDLATGIMLCDVDGLKLVNDTLGHSVGDKLLIDAACAIANSIPDDTFFARIGGDEFAVLIPNTDEKNLEELYNDINNSIDKINTNDKDFALTISIGYAFRTSPDISLSETFKDADNNMYKEKLHRSQSTRSSIVKTLMKALEARDFITEGHADRLQELIVLLAKASNLPERRIADLRLLAQFHDIGKVGISDKILFKPGPLTSDEMREMQRHCEIGYRIAISSPNLNHIADWILKHHESWDGSGYPIGLIGEDIPLECRMLAIADAYDAMTNDRPYRKALPHNEAIKELEQCAGTKFDPILVEKFIWIINNE